MPTDTPETHLITDAGIMMVLSSPARLEILEAACALGTCSAGEIAEMTGRSRTSLYPHIEQLVGAGLLIDAGTRPSGKRQEQLYRPIARQVNTRHDADDPSVVEYHVAYGKAACRMLSRVFESAIKNPDAVTRGPKRDTHCGAQTVWADDATLAEINRHLDRVWELCSKSQPGEGRRLVQVGMVLGPASRGKDD